MNIQNILSGFILRPARSGNSNAETTATATSGVVRHFEQWDSGHQTMIVEMYGSLFSVSVHRSHLPANDQD